MARYRLTTLDFNDLSLDDEWESPSRTITEGDVVLFAGLSGDFNPLHVDHDAAQRGPFGKPVAHGLLGMAVASGLASQAPRVETLAFLAILDWKFVRPIAFGDTVRVITRVESLEPRPHGRRGVVTWHRRLVNQHGEIVQEGRTQTLVKARAPDEPASPPG
ncbi:MAG TPA: MaoC/PaaZ C-terminal domain-containing protein [Isosphaeraceae bacterium]|jgi:acyl dehydratase|nr:MaoC/PaaZ C-terminal domain-containing protein [Isosphaeraceae bacterium]